jgi:hypothetical protein
MPQAESAPTTILLASELIKLRDYYRDAAHHSATGEERIVAHRHAERYANTVRAIEELLTCRALYGCSHLGERL